MCPGGRQLRYEVTTDVAFQQLAMVAWVRPSATRLMSFGQPEPTSGSPDPRKLLLIQENQSSAVEEIQLVGRQMPRVASVWVQGLRPSRPETQYQVRFSPAETIPTVLRIRAGSFTRAVAWSTLFGSVISIPAGAAFCLPGLNLRTLIMQEPDEETLGLH